jgi:hypothetical protein
MRAGLLWLALLETATRVDGGASVIIELAQRLLR